MALMQRDGPSFGRSHCFHVINRDNTQIEVFLKDDKPAWTGFWIAITWISYTDVITSRMLKKPLAGCSKRSRGEAREKSTSGGVLTVRCSEAIERQRSIWVFFSSLLERKDHGTKRLQNSR